MTSLNISRILESEPSARTLAAQAFYAKHGIPTRSRIERGERTTTWTIRHGETLQLIAGGIASSPEEAREAMRQRFDVWTLNGPPAWLFGRASW